MIDFDRNFELQREAIEAERQPLPDAPEWADTEEPRAFHGFCTTCGNTLLRRGPLCAVCAFNVAVASV